MNEELRADARAAAGMDAGMDTDKETDKETAMERSLVELTERLWEGVRTKQDNDPDSIWRGGPDPAANTAIQDLFGVAVPLYVNKHSRYYLDPDLRMNLEAQVAFMLRHQWDSGCISLMNCNINSPPDTAFTVRIVALCYRLLERCGDPACAPLTGELRRFLERAVPCLMSGGVHTPNHRWVMAGALALLYEIFGEAKLKERAYAYLDEGYDLTEQGEWTERSNGIYNAICNLFLYHAARVFGDDAIDAPIRKNMDLMPYMIHPDGRVATEFSNRQDLMTEAGLEPYYVVAQLMAAREGNALYQELADRALRDIRAAGRAKTGGEALLYTMVYPQEMKPVAEAAPLPEQYEFVLNPGHVVSVPKMANPDVVNASERQSAVLRYRRGRLSATLLSGRRMWLFLQYGRARMGLRLSMGWFGIASVRFPSIERRGDGRYRLQLAVTGDYRGPLPRSLAEPAQGNYLQMPNHLRETTHPVSLPIALDVAFGEREVQIAAEIADIPHVVLQFVCMFYKDGRIVSPPEDGLHPYARLAANGAVEYVCGGDAIRVQGPRSQHRIPFMRNDMMEEHVYNVLLNYTTPLRDKLTITLG